MIGTFVLQGQCQANCPERSQGKTKLNAQDSGHVQELHSFHDRSASVTSVQELDPHLWPAFRQLIIFLTQEGYNILDISKRGDGMQARPTRQVMWVYISHEEMFMTNDATHSTDLALRSPFELHRCLSMLALTTSCHM